MQKYEYLRCSLALYSVFLLLGVIWRANLTLTSSLCPTLPGLSKAASVVQPPSQQTAKYLVGFIHAEELSFAVATCMYKNVILILCCFLALMYHIHRD